VEALARTVSVVIPVRDDADHLERCLAALERQSDPPDEIVIVDNRSSDRTQAVAASHDVVYVREGQLGIPAAASAGYDAASGDIIARLDADSVPPEDWVHRLRSALVADPTLTAVTGPGVFDSLPALARRFVDVAYMRAYFAVFGGIIGRPPLFGSNFAMVRPAWAAARDRVHRHDPKVHDDLDLSFNLDPQTHVLLDRDLRVRVSARPFAHPLGFVWRAWRGIHTVLVNRMPGRRD
jgi:glycosyltransferase involved in cell wall biosynthesis